MGEGRVRGRGEGKEQDSGGREEGYAYQSIPVKNELNGQIK